MTLSALHVPPSTGKDPKGLIILLHGWGANAQDLMDLSSAFQLADMQFAFPNAPLVHPYNPTGRMWYDLESQHWDGLENARTTLNQWIENCIKDSGLPPERVVLGGFSQGGAMALEVGLGRSLAGLIVFSGYLHPHIEQRFAEERPTIPPVLVLHGQQDAVVPIQAAQHTQAVLENWNVNLQFHSFPTMGHEISAPALKLAQNFLQTILSQT